MTAELLTNRLRLRRFRADDRETIWPWVSDPLFPRQMNWDAHADAGVTAAWLASVADADGTGDDVVWALVDRSSDDVRGCMGLHGISRQQRAWRRDQAELGYWIGTPYWGAGLATEAAREVLRDGFERLALHKIRVGCVADNEASRRVIEKVGFRLVGVERDHFHRYGRWWDHLAYELIVEDWRNFISR